MHYTLPLRDVVYTFYPELEGMSDKEMELFFSKKYENLEIPNNLPVIGQRYDSKELYAAYSDKDDYQEFFEKASSDAIYSIVELIKRESTFLDLLIYAVAARKNIASHNKAVFTWRKKNEDGMRTRLNEGERNLLWKEMCKFQRSVPHEVDVKETEEGIKIISLLSDWKKKYPFKTSILEKYTETGEFLGENEILGGVFCSEFLPLYHEAFIPDPYHYLLFDHHFRHAILSESIEDKLRHIASFHYYMCLKTPILRGGGSLAEWMSAALLVHCEIPFVGWTLEVWNRAVTRGISEFIDEYPEYILASL